MRKADRIIRDRHSRIPDKYKKIDTTVNGGCGKPCRTTQGSGKKAIPSTP